MGSSFKHKISLFPGGSMSIFFWGVIMIIGVTAYLNIGFFFGHWCWMIGHSQEKKYRKIMLSNWGRILWPITRGEEHTGAGDTNAPIVSMEESGYKIGTAIFWPFKILESIVFVIFVAVIVSIVSFIYMLYRTLKIIFVAAVKMATLLTRKIVKINGISEISLKIEFTRLNPRYFFDEILCI
jgi:hypothetical protein